MKRCTNCNKEYDDDKVFCPECGVILADAVTSGTSSTPASSEINENLNTAGQPVTPVLDMSVQDTPWYSQWKGTILAVIGLIIEWNLSALFGVILIVVGFILGKKSPSSRNKAVTVALLVIGVILFLLFLIV